MVVGTIPAPEMLEWPKNFPTILVQSGLYSFQIKADNKFKIGCNAVANRLKYLRLLQNNLLSNKTHPYFYV